MLNISLYFEKPGMFQVYFMFIWGNTKCQVLYECIHEPTTSCVFFHVYFEKTQNVQYFMHIQETTNVEYFMGMPITLYTFKKTQNVEYFTLVLKKPWSLSILCECKVSHAYLRNENSKYLNAYLRKQKKVQYFIHTQETTYVKYFWECQVLLCIFEDPWM